VKALATNSLIGKVAGKRLQRTSVPARGCPASSVKKTKTEGSGKEETENDERIIRKSLRALWGTKGVSGNRGEFGPTQRNGGESGGLPSRKKGGEDESLTLEQGISDHVS